MSNRLIKHKENLPLHKRSKGLKTSMLEVGILAVIIVLAVLGTLYDEGALDRWIPSGLEEAIFEWGFIACCAIYSVSIFDRKPFVRHFFLWIYALGFVLLSVFKNSIVHSVSWDFQDSMWLLISILKVVCLLGFLHLAYLAVRDYQRIRTGRWGRYQKADELPRII